MKQIGIRILPESTGQVTRIMHAWMFQIASLKPIYTDLHSVRKFMGSRRGNSMPTFAGCYNNWTNQAAGSCLIARTLELMTGNWLVRASVLDLWILTMAVQQSVLNGTMEQWEF